MQSWPRTVNFCIDHGDPHDRYKSSHDMVSYRIISYHTMGTICLGYELSWVRLVLGTNCLGYDLSWVRVVMGTSCPGYETSWVRVVLGTNCPGCELSWVRVVLGTSCRRYELSWVRVVHNPSGHTLGNPVSRPTHRRRWRFSNRVNTTGQRHRHHVRRPSVLSDMEYQVQLGRLGSCGNSFEVAETFRKLRKISEGSKTVSKLWKQFISCGNLLHLMTCLVCFRNTEYSPNTHSGTLWSLLTKTRQSRQRS